VDVPGNDYPKRGLAAYLAKSFGAHFSLSVSYLLLTTSISFWMAIDPMKTISVNIPPTPSCGNMPIAQSMTIIVVEMMKNMIWFLSLIAVRLSHMLYS
jgi:hypothetical protein